jgi:hypothetical protein
MKGKIPVALSITALIIALLGFTSLSGAAYKSHSKAAKASSVAKKKKPLRGPRGFRGLRGRIGPQGPQGQQGPQGLQGPAGAPNSNATALDGYAANGLIRAARASGAIYPSSTALSACETYTNLATVAINAPGAGFVQVSGAYTARNLGVGGTVEGQLLATGGAVSPILYSNVGTGGASLASLTSTWVFPVAAAGAFNVTLRACSFATGADAFNAQLSAIFEPFGSSGGATLGPASAPTPHAAGNPAP